MAGGAGRIGRGGRRAESAAVRRAESTAVRLAESAAEWRAEFTGHPELPEICPAGPLNGDFPILTLRGPQEKTVPRKPPTEKPRYRASLLQKNRPQKHLHGRFYRFRVARWILSLRRDDTDGGSAPAFKANLPIRILMLTFAPVSTGVDRHFHGTLSGEVPVSAVTETMCG